MQLLLCTAMQLMRWILGGTPCCGRLLQVNMRHTTLLCCTALLAFSRMPAQLSSECAPDNPSLK